MGDKYDAISGACDSLLREMAPYLTSDTVDAVVGAANAIVRSQRPRDWAFSDAPRSILGITADGEKVLYGDDGKLGYYHTETYEKLHQRVSHMVEEACAEQDAWALSTEAMRAKGAERIGRDLRVQHLEMLLASLESLTREEVAEEG